jgi:glycosyltransferase involved in cell wall biosynthesis
MGQAIRDADQAEPTLGRAPHPGVKVCVHTLRPARTDVRAMRTATALARAGFTVVVVDIEHTGVRPSDESLTSVHPAHVAVSRTEDLGGVRFRHIVMSRRLARHYDPGRLVLWLLFKGLRMLLGLLEVVRTPADIYHASDMTALPACYIAARLRHKPVIFEPYELPLAQPWITRWRLLHAVSVHVLRNIVPHCAGVIVTSPSYAGELRRRYGGQAPVVIRNIPEYQPPVTSDRLHRRLGLDSEMRIALYQGNLQADRGLDVLVYAARFLAPGAVVVMMGGGADRGAFESLVAQERVSDRVKIIPAVPYDELLLWTASADIGLIIFRTEAVSYQLALPNKVFEYVMAGVPVLASPLEAVVDLLERYQVGRAIASTSPQAVGLAINSMLSDQDARARMRHNALAAAKRDLRWEVESHRLLQLYFDVLGRRGASSDDARLSVASRRQ